MVQTTSITIAIIELIALLFPMVLLAIQYGTTVWTNNQILTATRLGIALMLVLTISGTLAIVSLINQINPSPLLLISLSILVIFFIVFITLMYHIHKGAVGRSSSV